VAHNVQLTIPDATIEDVKPVISEVRNRLSVMTKLKWALKDKEKFKKLIAELRTHSEALYRLCPENAFESMNIYLTLECLAKQESPAGLKWTSKLASQHAEVDERSLMRKGYELLATTATLKALVNENRGREEANDGSLPRVDEVKPEMWYLGKGLALFEGEVVYVEMRDYRGAPLDFTPEQKQRLKRRRRRARFSASLLSPRFNEADESQIYQDNRSEEDEEDEPIERVRPIDVRLRSLIRNFFNTFQAANMMKSVYGLDIAGMIDHTEGEHKGHCSILYKLPGTIGTPSRERPPENLKLRAPVTLQSLLRNKQQRGIRCSLGARFELARKLVRAVCLLHSSGWLHKNIRAESVMFFPKSLNALQDDGYELKTEIDVSEPSLMGYIFSRPDDIIMRQDRHDPISTKGPPPEYGKKQSWHTKIWDEPTYGNSQMGRGIGNSRFDSVYSQNTLGTIIAPEETKQTNISGFTLDYYQHPAKHADPKRLYRHAYDVYSLGILLIEIGLWETLKNYEANYEAYYTNWNEDPEEDHYERRTWICREYMDRLRWQCGDTYADVALSCLMIDSSDDEVAKASERELCVRIIADL